MTLDGVNGAGETGKVRITSKTAKNTFIGDNIVNIPMNKQSWAPNTIVSSDYSSINGLRKHFSMSDWKISNMPEGDNSKKVKVNINGQKIELDSCFWVEKRATGEDYMIGTKNGQTFIYHVVHGDKHHESISIYNNDGQLQFTQKSQVIESLLNEYYDF